LDWINQLQREQPVMVYIYRDSAFFEELYFSLVKRYHLLLSYNRTFGLTLKEVLLIDFNIIRLFSNILKGVGLKPVD
jgi:hypothetical protein